MSALLLSIRVYGHPAPQGSKRAIVHKQSGKAVVMESSKAVKPWRADVKQAALDAIPDGQPPHDGPVVAHMTFLFQRPKGHYRTGRNAHLLRDAAPPYPHGKPDLSKLVRSTEDALAGVVWTDDSRVVWIRARKVWADLDGRPGALISISPAEQHTPEGLTA